MWVVEDEAEKYLGNLRGIAGSPPMLLAAAGG